MQLFLHINISREPLLFSADRLPEIRDWVSGVSCFDMDNFSDALTIQTAIKAMTTAEKIFINIVAESDTEAGGTLKILSQLLKITSPVAILYNGENEKLNRILFRFKDKQIEEKESLEKAVKQFFNPTC